MTTELDSATLLNLVLSEMDPRFAAYAREISELREVYGTRLAELEKGDALF